MQPVAAIEYGLWHCWKNIIKPVCHNSVRNSCVSKLTHFPRGLAGRILASCGPRVVHPWSRGYFTGHFRDKSFQAINCYQCHKQQLDRLLYSSKLKSVYQRRTSPVNRWMISNACLTMRIAISFLPLLRPCIINESVRRSTIGHCALRKRFTW